MLYNAYELQRSMLAGASALANFSAGLLNNPANPFAYFGGGPILASALEVFAMHRRRAASPNSGWISPKSTASRSRCRGDRAA
jgi:poly(3-hydroxybutyrate) depolymerase